MFFVEFMIVLVCILIGARIGGIGLGVMGGVGLAVLSFIFGLQPTSPPINVMLMIMAVVAAAASMQAAGGLDFDRTGTTNIGKFIFNHSFMVPGLLSMVFSIMFGFLFTGIVL